MENMDIRLLSFNIDGTLLGKSNTNRSFKKLWNHIDPAHRPILCYNTGRLLDNTLQLIEDKKLPEPDYIISGLGTNIYSFHEKRLIKSISEVMEEGWDISKVEQVVTELPYLVSKQPKHLQNAYKSSWYFDEATFDQIQHVERALDEAELDVSVVYSSARFLDVLPKWANKGNALIWFLKYLRILSNQVLVTGYSGNDNEAFLIQGVRGIIVGNAQPELYQATKHLPVYHAQETHIDGVAEGLAHYRIISEDTFQSGGDFQNDPIDISMIERLDGEAVPGLEKAQLEFIRWGYEKAIEALRRDITPLGFSACSLSDNESRGTDENYHSVWARDGAITVIGSMPLHDDQEINRCQRQTLETLISHITPNGQIPANVRIDDQRPDYSGVGRICSIDSGLWVIIAFYEYVKTTRDIDFLRQYFKQLQQVMDWLSAHDSNNDALLEIPEAGDWTDLFGRSYNVLYDEVLWYRANICFGRILELLGDHKRAGDYLRWSQVIKKEILLNFWPSTQPIHHHSVGFDAQQYSLGDASYLIAQVTPFDFSWRCDVYGNVLAYLFDVLDTDQASLAFRFMWGAGVNDPYPVTNVYPPVSAGDAEWKHYYTVNLLNLPNHYHNGGIWPFVGGPWVRFINKLGLRELALQELLKLAELNKLGIHHEWEFNEWAHGKTGRPMGKAFQAWSASEYILACHALKVVNSKKGR